MDCGRRWVVGHHPEFSTSLQLESQTLSHFGWSSRVLLLVAGVDISDGDDGDRHSHAFARSTAVGVTGNGSIHWMSLSMIPCAQGYISTQLTDQALVSTGPFGYAQFFKKPKRKKTETMRPQCGDETGTHL